MNTDLKLKFLQYLNQKKQSSGFTWFEILFMILRTIPIVIFLIFFMVFLNITIMSLFFPCGIPRKSEAMTYILAVNKRQQTFYTEKKQFSRLIELLGVEIKTNSVNYNYHIKLINSGTNAIAVGYSSTTTAGAALKNYVGFVSLIPSKDNPKEFTSQAILCEQTKAGDPASFNIEWKVGIERPKCNQSQVEKKQN